MKIIRHRIFPLLTATAIFIGGTVSAAAPQLGQFYKTKMHKGTITVAALTSLLFGAKTIEEACEEEGVRMSERMKAEMEKIREQAQNIE